MFLFTMKLLTVTFLLELASVSTGTSENAFSVYQMWPSRTTQLRVLIDLYENSDEKLDFWRAPSSLNNSVEVMVYPEVRDKFVRLLNDNDIKYIVVIEDLAELIHAKEDPGRTSRRSVFARGERRLKDVAPSSANGIEMGEYHAYDRIVQWLATLEQKYPRIFQTVSIGRSREGRSIVGAKIGSRRDNSTKVVWIDGGIHAREWVSVHTAIYFIQQLITGYGSDQAITDYIDNLQIYVFPCLNPDGYEYSRSSPTDPRVRMWRKNMSPEKCNPESSNKTCCKGVDLNRNFAFRFAEIGSSSLPCSEIYHGESAFSEPESRAVRDAVLSFGPRLEAFITLHAYSQLWIYPFSHKKYTYSADINELKAVARKAVASLQKVYGTQYRIGTGPEIIYPYAGGSGDWVKESARVKYTYTIELRPSYYDWNGFVLDKRQLVPTGRETFEGVKVVLEKVIAEERKRNEKPKPCVDTSTACAHWMAQNPAICVNSRLAMEVQCRRTCSLCNLPSTSDDR